MSIMVLKKYASLYISLLAIGLVMAFLFLRPGEAVGGTAQATPLDVTNNGKSDFTQGDTVKAKFTVEYDGGNDVVTGLELTLKSGDTVRETFTLQLKSGGQTVTSGSVTLQAKVGFSELKKVGVSGGFGYGYDGPSGGNKGGVITVETEYIEQSSDGAHSLTLAGC